MTPTEYFKNVVQVIEHLNLEEIGEAVDLAREAWINGRQVICFGNGGSALTAQHYVTDWNKGVYEATGKPFFGKCLNNNIGLVTAYSNDVSYEAVFEAQLPPILNKNDLVIGISGSGNSKNVIRAIEYANRNGATTIGIYGYYGGGLRDECRHHLHIHSHDMQVIEDVCQMFGHLVMKMLIKEGPQ